ncbi:hypothetical protein [Nocardia fluminea]|uniref:hypothetical protein n=1 Tax=Nocardia fluminea TaxID=134984 RepID=UPI0033C87DA6
MVMTLVIVLGFIAIGIGAVVTTVVWLIHKATQPQNARPLDGRWVAGSAGMTGYVDGTSGLPWDPGGPSGGCGGGSNSGCGGGSSGSCSGGGSSCSGGSSSSCGGGSSSSCGGGS